jgi:hypothetical protein
VKPSEVLEHAAVVLMERGHYKGNYEAPGGGPVCLHGAINCALAGDPNVIQLDPVANTVVAALSFTARRPDLATWNDLESTSAEDVILLCKKTAAMLAEGGR